MTAPSLRLIKCPPTSWPKASVKGRPPFVEKIRSISPVDMDGFFKRYARLVAKLSGVTPPGPELVR